MATQNFETLRARVQELGCQLFVDNADDGDPRLYLHDPKIDKHVLVGATVEEVEEWLETEEERDTDADEQQAIAAALERQKAAGLHADASPWTTRDDFNAPHVRETYEQFLGLLVIAGPKDRYAAMDVRRERGVEAAVEYLGKCTITDEPYEPDDAPPKRVNTPYDEVLLGLERCQALGRAIQHESDDGDEHAALYTLLDRELDAIDKIVETNRQWNGDRSKGGAS